MRAVHWVRSRQEERELVYWLSIVAYDPRDRSFNNRVYLIYLILFFAVWLFITLTFFASGGAAVLRLLSPADPVRAAVLLEIGLVGAWSVWAFGQAVRRSPVVFSEADEVLICQMPVSRRAVTARWVWMPWLKTAIPFWLAAIVLGFSAAEILMPGVLGANRIPEYAGYGLRAWLAILPVQLALFLLQWSAGVARLQKDSERRWLAWIAIPAVMVFFAVLLAYPESALSLPFSAGLSGGALGLSLAVSGLAALAAFAILVGLSGSFSLSRAAQETRTYEAIQTAAKYGLNDYAETLQKEQRLGVERKPSRLPAYEGAPVLLWKGVLQSQRSLSLGGLMAWVQVFLAMLAFPLLPDLSSRALAIAFWVFVVGKAAVTRLRSDLAVWSLVRQLPIADRRFLLFDLLPAYALTVGISIAGLAIGSALFQGSSVGLALLVPGMAAGAAGMAAWDVLRRSKSSHLFAGSVPQVGAGGILLGFLLAAVPVAVQVVIGGGFGLALALVVSVGLGAIAFSAASYSYRNLDAG